MQVGHQALGTERAQGLAGSLGKVPFLDAPPLEQHPSTVALLQQQMQKEMQKLISPVSAGVVCQSSSKLFTLGAQQPKVLQMVCPLAMDGNWNVTTTV